MKIEKTQVIIVVAMLVVLVLLVGAFMLPERNQDIPQAVQNLNIPETVQNPKPDPNIPSQNELIMRYHPNENVDISLNSFWYPEKTTPSQKNYKYIIKQPVSIDNNISHKNIGGYDEDFDYITAELSDDGITITTAISLLISDNYKSSLFTIDRYYEENGSLYRSSKLILDLSAIDDEQIKKLKNEISEYKSGKKSATTNYERLLNKLTILAFSGDEESIQVLKDENKFAQIYGNILDGHIGETYHFVAGEYRIFKRLRDNGGSITEKIKLDNPDTASTSVQH